MRFELWARWIFPTLGVLAALLGFTGFVLSGVGPHAAFFRTLHLYGAGVAPQDMHGSALVAIASVLAPVAGIGTLLAAAGQWLRRRWQELRLRLRPADDLFIGGGERAAALAAALHEQSPEGASRFRVGLDPQPGCALSGTPRPGRALRFVMQGDARSALDLRRANARRAGRVWLLTGDDALNLDLAHRLEADAPPGRSRQGARFVVGVRDRRLLRADGALRSWKDASAVSYLDLARSAARSTWLRHPPVQRAAGDDAPAHVAVIGDGALAEALVAQAVAHWVVDERASHAVRVSVFGAHSAALLERVQLRLPALAPAAGSHPLLAPLLPLADLRALVCDVAEVPLDVWHTAQGEARFCATYVATGDDLLTVAAATRALALREAEACGLAAAPVVACLEQTHATRQPALQARGLHWLAVHAACVEAGEAYPGEHLDARARWVNLAWDASIGPIADAAQLAAHGALADARWAALEEEFRWSSRAAADHMDVKLACLGLDAGRSSNAAGVALASRAIEAELGRLMRLEHRRFVVERLLDGWLPLTPARRGADAPAGLEAGEQKRRLRLNATLVPYDELPTEEQRKDERVVRATPAIIATALQQRQRGAAPAQGPAFSRAPAASPARCDS